MSPLEYQQWLNAHGQQVPLTGTVGPTTRAATVAAFSSKCAGAVTDADIAAFAKRLGCTVKQVRAVTKVESGGQAFDSHGRPKMLFERHLFSRMTDKEFDTCAWSNPKGGGYSEDSWNKLCHAAGQDVLAAFGSASWGKFQVLGLHWRALGYPSSLELAYSTVTSETAHYELFARFLEANNLVDALRRISARPSDNVAFARGYNGPAYQQFKYDEKIAEAMR